ncbi:HMA2 domain-containing protein [Pectobacterium sp. B1J-3]|uniref:HMA2 domain-containing protein n=1 Tax=Pectobacterium sp. B1J-3 TaxID=3385371 RepID=UPI003905E1E8
MELDDLSGLMMLRRFVAVEHHIPGRIRLRFTNRLIPSIGKGKLEKLEALCHPENALRSYTFNHHTGSVLLEYDTSRIKPEVLTQLFGSDDAAAQHALEQLVQSLSPLS